MLLCYYVCDKYCFPWWQVLSYYGHPSPWGPAGLHNASLRSGFVNGNRVWCSRMSDRLQAYSRMLTVATLTVTTLSMAAFPAPAGGGQSYPKLYPGCNPVHPGCNPMHPDCNPVHRGCNPVHPGGGVGGPMAEHHGAPGPRPHRAAALRQRPLPGALYLLHDYTGHEHTFDDCT